MPLKEFLAKFHAPRIRLAANSFGVYVGPLARPLVMRFNLPGGKFWRLIILLYSPGGESFEVFLDRWRGLCRGFLSAAGAALGVGGGGVRRRHAWWHDCGLSV